MKTDKIFEVSYKRYDEILCVLPPIRHQNGCFLVGEPYDHQGENNAPRYECFAEYKNKCYNLGKLSVKQFDIFIKEKDLFFRVSGY